MTASRDRRVRTGRWSSHRVLAVVAALLAAAVATSRAAPPAVRAVAISGQPAPGGGTFDRFNVESLPILAPVNAKGQVAFFATLARAKASEGIFLASDGKISRVAADGDAIAGAGLLSGFGKHPVPALNESGTVAFAAALAGGKAVEGIFSVSGAQRRAVALSGGPAPGIPAGTLAGLDSPALNDRGDVAFLATVRRGRESIEAVYLRSGPALRKVIAQGDPAPSGGSLAAFGMPALNNRGVIAFAAAVEGRAVPGGVFVSEGDQVKMLVAAGDATPVGGIFAKFSERVGISDTGAVAFNALLKNAPAAAGVFVAEAGQVRKLVALGDAAPGGGTFSYLGLWPALSARGALAIAASVDGGASQVAVFRTAPSGLERVAGLGDTLPGGTTLASLTLYPVAAVSPTGAVTFAAAPGPSGEGAEGIFLAGPPTER